jgi:hypothetical protein
VEESSGCCLAAPVRNAATKEDIMEDTKITETVVPPHPPEVLTPAVAHSLEPEAKAKTKPGKAKKAAPKKRK